MREALPVARADQSCPQPRGGRTRRIDAGQDATRHVEVPVVAEGQGVKAGEELAVVEAEKIENVPRAERDGEVKKIAAAPRESLAVDQVIIEFE